MLLSAKTIFDPDAKISAAQEREFFRSIRLPNGVFKTTASHRLDDVNHFVGEYWDAKGYRPSRLLDVGASSCVSSVEWAEERAKVGHAVEIVATDVLIDVEWLEIRRGHFVLADKRGNILQHEIGGRALRSWVRRRDWLGSDWYRILRANRRAKERLTHVPASKRHPMKLVCNAAQLHPNISFCEQDVLSPPQASFRGKFDAVRAANILNRAYFAAPDLAKAVENLRACLGGAGSYLLVTRTWDCGTNHGTLFELLENGRFEVVNRLGDGSEIEEIVLASSEGTP